MQEDHLEANKSIQEGRHLMLESIVFVLSLTNTVAEVLEVSITGKLNNSFGGVC